ncbi:alpha/beta fold hydrolase [Sunxiuqinia sp. A32]|uniref:alpha/beta fold hydrolase n=1 Tax=Sunxiuqinia sp. A32 TaxID=3461496 RepID=UPI00404630DC
MSLIRTLPLFVFLFLLSFQYQVYGQSNPIGTFIESPTCPFSLPDGLNLGENFKFGYIDVPEFHDRSSLNSIRLAVAIFPCSNPSIAEEPIVMNTSGPGKSNLDNFIPQIAGGLGNYLLPNRDIVIIELRGLRYSSSFLACGEVFEANKDMLDENLSVEETMFRLGHALRNAKQRFERENINLSAYNNLETAKDIHMVMDALGYNKFNLVGSSAGTLVAHHVIREKPDRVRCAILDAGLPIDSTILFNYVPIIINSLKNYFKECQEDSLCQNSFPNMEERFLKLMDHLNKEPKEVRVKDPESGNEVSVLINGYRLAEHVLLHMFYSTQIPVFIGNILDGDYSSFADFAIGKLSPKFFADGLGYTVFINEAGYYELSDIDIDPKYQTFADGITLSGLGGRYLLEVQKQWKIKCAQASKEIIHESFDTPLLVLNGKYDPVIPVQYDEVLKKQYTNCYIYRFDGVPHSAFDNATSCALPMILEFLNNPIKAPNSDCMNNFKQKYNVK